MRIVIGSTAIKAHFPEFRDPKDLDLFTPVRIPGTECFWHRRLYDHSWAALQRVNTPHGDLWAAEPDELYTIKLSHAYWALENGSWSKHMHDLMFLKEKGAKVIQPLHDLLYSIWVEKHGAKKANFQKESDEFFRDAVERKYDHDSLHESVAYYDRPLYIRALKDGHSVKIDPRKLWALPVDDIVKMFREEIYVTALERILIPNNYKTSHIGAYRWALRRTVTSLTRGVSAQFIAENYDTFRKPDIDYVALHLANKHKLIELEK